jgi:hypothetical protein
MHDTMQDSIAISNHGVLVSDTNTSLQQSSNTQQVAFTLPTSHTDIHKQSPHPAQTSRYMIHAHSQPATHVHFIHSRTPVQQQPHTLHVSFVTGTMKCRHAEYLYSTVNRIRPMPCTTPCRATTATSNQVMLVSKASQPLTAHSQ